MNNIRAVHAEDPQRDCSGGTCADSWVMSRTQNLLRLQAGTCCEASTPGAADLIVMTCQQCTATAERGTVKRGQKTPGWLGLNTSACVPVLAVPLAAIHCSLPVGMHCTCAACQRLTKGCCRRGPHFTVLLGLTANSLAVLPPETHIQRPNTYLHKGHEPSANGTPTPDRMSKRLECKRLQVLANICRA